MAAIQECKFKHPPPTSPDLTPTDYYCFLKMKKELSDTNDDVIPAVDHFLEVQDIDFDKERICLLCGL